MTAWHTMAPEAVAAELDVKLTCGLTEADAARRLGQYGANELPEAPPASPLGLLLKQFSSAIIWVLLAAAAISGLMHDWVDAVAILAIVLLNALLGFLQEFRAERSLAALKRLSITTARVIREGSLRSIPARQVVPGDVIQVEAGDRIPADARLIYATGLRTQEASLTGESAAVVKETDPILHAQAPLGDRRNMIFMGTVAVAGKGRAVVTTTGVQTELGRIAALIRTAAEAEQAETPLQRRLEQFGHALLWVSLGIVALVFLLGLLRGEPPIEMFLTAVSLAVAAIPEGLPAVVTVTLALGVTRMVRRHALIRRLPAVETLGSTMVICSDKTGTLTKNEMTVTMLYQGGELLKVTGEGYRPCGEILVSGGPVKLEARPGLATLLQTAVLCNGAQLRQEDGRWTVLGDPTEGALLVAAAKAGIWKSHLEREFSWLGEVPFDPERKKMTIVRRTSSGPIAYVKGAPDVLVRDCRTVLNQNGQAEPLTDKIRDEILAINRQFASQALRVLAMAMRRLDRPPQAYTAAALEHDLTFVGLMAMKDPIRPEAKVAVQTCQAAGIRIVMITGDHQETAIAIARELGIMGPGARGISGPELDALPDAQLGDCVERIAVYARVSAEHKLRIVRAWKQRGAVVAMTGDGMNDAPAVKAADIGIAMGVTGTDVTKEASDMIIMDDNFASIAAAVEEGRGIFDNIRKSIQYLLSCNVSEILLMLLATLLALPLPLLPVQILWINLVTDGFPALALAVEPAEADLMQRPPRPPSERLLTGARMLTLFIQGAFMAAVTLLAFVYCLYRMDLNLERARALTFTALVFAQLSHALNTRSEGRSLFELGLWTNKPLLGAVVLSALLQAAIILSPAVRDLFKVVPFNPEHWLLAIVIGILPLVVMEIWKAVARRRRDASRSRPYGLKIL